MITLLYLNRKLKILKDLFKEKINVSFFVSLFVYYKLFLISLILILPLQSSFSQVVQISIDKMNNMSNVITEDSLVGDNLEQVQNRSNATGNTVEDFEEKE